MALTVKSLIATTLSAASFPAITYAPTAGKGAVIKSILFVNPGGGSVTVTAKLTRATGTGAVNICPPGMSIPANSSISLDTEITLSYVDAGGSKIEITALTGNIDCVVSGVERDN